MGGRLRSESPADFVGMRMLALNERSDAQNVISQNLEGRGDEIVNEFRRAVSAAAVHAAYTVIVITVLGDSCVAMVDDAFGSMGTGFDSALVKLADELLEPLRVGY
jgi:hypothetical protein